MSARLDPGTPRRAVPHPPAAPAMPPRGWFARTHVAVLLLLAVVVLFGGIATRELHGTPTFYGSLVREIVDSGDPMAIFRGPEAYFLKPPLVLWLTALSVEVLGATNAAATLVPRLAGLACVLLVYLVGRRLASPTAGWFAALVLLTNSTFVQFTTTLRMDSLMLAGILLSVLGWLAPERRWGDAGLFGGITIAVLAKGPLGLLPLALFALDALVLRRGPRPLPDWRAALLLLPLPLWYATLLASHGAQPVADLVADVARPDPVPASGALRSYFEHYVLLPAQRYWPWLPFMALGLVPAFRRAAPDAGPLWERWLGVWVLLMLALCALKPDRDIRYLYPALPALALLAGLCLARLVRGRGLEWAAGATLGAAVVALVGVLALGWGGPDTRAEVAAMREATARVLAAGETPIVLGEYPVVPGTPRRQNAQHDWVHYYLGFEPRIVSQAEARAGGLRGAPLVLAMRSRGHAEQLAELGFEPAFRSKEMVLAFPR